MRSWLLMGITVIALFGLFVLYTRMVAPPARIAASPATLPMPANIETPSAAGGEPVAAGAWVNLYDKNARFYGRLRSAACVPTPDHLYHLIHPQAQFFQLDGQIVDLTATDGEVAMSGQASRIAVSSAPMEAPSRGTLRNVTMNLYAGQAAEDRHDPDMTVHMAAAQFDADTDQISTADLTDAATGRITPAENIPVAVLGRDMDIYGKGLMLYWDGQAHDLKSLLLKHGDHLLLKNTASPDAKPAAAAAGPAEAANPAVDARRAGETKPAVAAAAPQPAAASPAAPPDSRRYYRALFSDNVRVVEGEKQPIQADSMQVTIAEHGDSPTTKPASVGSESPAQTPDVTGGLSSPSSGTPGEGGGGGQSPTNSIPTLALPRSTGGGNQSSTPIVSRATAVPAVQSPLGPHPAATQPTLVYWTGPLTIKPLVDPGETIVPGQEIIRFLGSSHVHLDTLDAVGQRIRYDSSTGDTRMAGAANKPMVLTVLRPDGKAAGVVTADRVDISQSPARDLIVFTGPGKANFSSPDKPGELQRAAWEKECDLTVTPAAQQRYLCRAVLIGNAFVSDGPPAGKDKLHLSGQQIAADFDPPPLDAAKSKKAGTDESAAVGPLRQVVTTGNAVCVIHDDKEADRTLASDQLTVETARDAAGKDYPKFVTAVGNVYGTQDQQDLRSRRLDVTLVEAAAAAGSQAKVELQNLLATGNVIAHGKNGQSVQSDTLTIEQQGERQTVTVLGSPRAVVASQNGTLRGAHIQARPKEDWAEVFGPGEIDGTSAAAPGKPPQPMHVEWTDSAEFSGDHADVHGGVVAHSREANGTLNDATADNAHLDFMPKPGPAKIAGAAKKPPADPMGNQQVKLIRLLDHAAVTSTLSSPAGAIVRRAYISGNEIDADNSRQTLTVPGPGRMLLEDHPPATASKKNIAAASSGPADSRGTNGFWWSGSFVFDEPKNQAVIDGEVTIKHLPDAAADAKSPKTEAVTVLADHVVADFEKPASQEMNDQMKLKQMVATGHVQIKANGATIDAAVVVDDAVTQILIASGTSSERVRVINDKDRTQAYFKEVWIDTKTNTIQKMIDFTGNKR